MGRDRPDNAFVGLDGAWQRALELAWHPSSFETAAHPAASSLFSQLTDGAAAVATAMVAARKLRNRDGGGRV